jgi:small glutamine-rich tetratricopeptide repeat-containing protein alpha
MSKRAYDDALKQYTAAIELSPKPVYYSNRAAAYTSIGKFEEAAEDAERALELDPSFVRAYSRLGHAKLQLQQYDRAIKAYEDGLALEPTNANMKAGLAAAKQEHKEQGVSAEGSSSARSAAAPSAGAGAGGMPDLASMANMFGGAGGGMPDLASMMQNPQMMAM